MSARRVRPSLKLRHLVWLAFPLVFWWLARHVPRQDWQDLARSIRLTHIGILIALNALIVFLFSARWWLVLRAFGQKIPYLALLQYRLAAFSVSYFTPGTQFGGEPLQVYALEKRHALPRSTALASVGIDKLFELLANFTFLAFGLVFSLQGRLLAGVGSTLALLWAGGLLSIPLVYLAAISRGGRPLSALIARLPARVRRWPWFAPLETLLQDSENQASGLIRTHPAALFSIVAASLWVWALMLAEYWLALHALGASLTLRQTVLAMTAARLAFLTPLPAGLGALEAGQALAMQALGFNPALGIALSLWIRLRDLATGGLGLFFVALLVHSAPSYSLSAETGD